jgi:hypothetical protein
MSQNQGYSALRLIEIISAPEFAHILLKIVAKSWVVEDLISPFTDGDDTKAFEKRFI